MVARDLRLIEQTLRNWVKADKQSKLNPPDGKAVTPEQMELLPVRAEKGWLRMENEISGKSDGLRRQDDERNRRRIVFQFDLSRHERTSVAVDLYRPTSI